MFTLPVWLRRELGMKVPGPAPGFKRKPAKYLFKQDKVDTMPMWSATHAAIDLKGSLEDVSALPPGAGLLVKESVLNRRYKNWLTAVASIRPMVKGGRVSIRRVIGRGANDVLILRTK